jgi:hypothetical protein
MNKAVRELAKSASRALGALYGKFASCGGMTYSVCHPFRRLEAQFDTVFISLSPSVRFNLLISRMHESFCLQMGVIKQNIN